MASRKDRVMLSDQFLKRKDFGSIINFINEKKIKKVVIVGGSHSGFSAAWLLLNGPADVFHNSHMRSSCASHKKQKFPDAVFKTIQDCQ